MAKGFVSVPEAPRFVLRNASWFSDDMQGGERTIVRGDIVIANGRFEHVGDVAAEDLPVLDLRGGLVLPGFVDIHTHLDKGHIWHRSPNPDGTFLGALSTAEKDREARWNSDDVQARMDFSLRCAYVHGTVAVRTHLDSIGKQTAISWAAFDQVRAAWQDKITLQAVALFPVDMVLDDPDQFAAIVKTVARYRGVLGGVTFRGQPVTAATHRALDGLIQAAAAHGLDIDLHVDESASPDARTLEAIADAAMRQQFSGKILCGHCCSLALLDDMDRERVIEKLVAARIAIVSLPMCNLVFAGPAGGPHAAMAWRGAAA